MTLVRVSLSENPSVDVPQQNPASHSGVQGTSSTPMAEGGGPLGEAHILTSQPQYQLNRRHTTPPGAGPPNPSIPIQAQTSPYLNAATNQRTLNLRGLRFLRIQQGNNSNNKRGKAPVHYSDLPPKGHHHGATHLAIRPKKPTTSEARSAETINKYEWSTPSKWASTCCGSLRERFGTKPSTPTLRLSFYPHRMRPEHHLSRWKHARTERKGMCLLESMYVCRLRAMRNRRMGVIAEIRTTDDAALTPDPHEVAAGPQAPDGGHSQMPGSEPPKATKSNTNFMEPKHSHGAGTVQAPPAQRRYVRAAPAHPLQQLPCQTDEKKPMVS
jgi:hypothetical protein